MNEDIENLNPVNLSKKVIFHHKSILLVPQSWDLTMTGTEGLLLYPQPLTPAIWPLTTVHIYFFLFTSLLLHAHRHLQFSCRCSHSRHTQGPPPSESQIPKSSKFPREIWLVQDMRTQFTCVASGQFPEKCGHHELGSLFPKSLLV